MKRKPPKVSRRKIGSAPRLHIFRRMLREAVKAIESQEDALFIQFCRDYPYRITS